MSKWSPMAPIIWSRRMIFNIQVPFREVWISYDYWLTHLATNNSNPLANIVKNFNNFLDENLTFCLFWCEIKVKLIYSWTHSCYETFTMWWVNLTLLPIQQCLNQGVQASLTMHRCSIKVPGVKAHNNPILKAHNNHLTYQYHVSKLGGRGGGMGEEEL